MTSIEAQLHEALGTIKQQAVEIADLKGAITGLRIKHAGEKREAVLRESGLSQTAVERLHSAFAKSKDNCGLSEAINVELRREREQDSLVGVRR